MSSDNSSSFVPTTYELLQIARYWAEVAIDIEYKWFLFEEFGANESRQRTFAWSRIAQISEVLGSATVDKEVDSVYEELGKKADPRWWNAFLHGTPEEREAVQELIRRMLGPGENEP